MWGFLFIVFLIFGSGFAFGALYQEHRWTRQLEKRKQERARARVENERL